MRLLVLKNTKHQSDYTAYIHALLEDIGRMENYHLHVAVSLDAPYPSANQVITFVNATSNSFITRLIEQQKLHSFLKENNIDLLVQNAFSPFKQKTIPQLLIADDIDKMPAVKKISFSKIFLLTYSQFAKGSIADKGFTNFVHVVPFAAGAPFQPITWSLKQQIKIDYTEGTEYFIVPDNFVSLEEILKLLKTFSAFKKWQHSSMKLVLTGKLQVPHGDWNEKLNTYRYREDILIYNQLPQEKKGLLLAGAYACIHLLRKDDELLPLLQAIQCRVPMIAFETPSVQEYAAGAVLTVPAGNYEVLAEQMILLYKDENLRNKLAENCAAHADILYTEKTTQLLQSILF